MEAQKVFWLGKHATQQQWGAPVSKVHKAGLDLLRSLGWEQVPNDTPQLPVFAFTTRKGANYPANQAGLPVVRQLPQKHTSCLDDKRQLHKHLKAGGQEQLLPRSWISLDEYLSWLQQQHQTQALAAYSQGSAAAAAANTGAPCDVAYTPSTPSTAIPDVPAPMNAGPQPSSSPCNSSNNSSSDRCSLPGNVFVKHRSGVKGQAVYVVQTRADLVHLQQKLRGSAADFIVQQEVAPPLLLDGRKTVLRLHVLVVLSQPRLSLRTASPARPAVDAAASTAVAVCHAAADHAAGSYTAAAAQAVEEVSKDDARQGLQVWTHEDVIVVPHAAAYDAGSSNLAVHVSSKGSNHPEPLLLQQLLELHEQVWPQLQQLAACTINGVSQALVPAVVDPGSQVYHLFGFDCMIEAPGRVVLLEVNSYPAIASGTMSAVNTAVYTRLVNDMVGLLVLPLTDNKWPQPGGVC